MTLRVRRPRSDEIAEARDCMVGGFVADPLYRWLHPDEATRPGLIGEVVTPTLQAAAGSGSAWVLDDLVAVAVLTEDGVDLIDARTEASYRQLLERQIGRHRANDAFAGMAACATSVPSGPHDASAGAATRVLPSGMPSPEKSRNSGGAPGELRRGRWTATRP